MTCAGAWAWARTNRLALDALPMAARRAIFHSLRAPYGVTGIHAGETEAVHAKTLERC